MFARSSLFVTVIFGFLFALLSLPLSTYALPTPVAEPVALALPAPLPHNPTSLMGRAYTNNHARAPSAVAADTPSVILRRDVDEQLIKRGERFQRRMEHARRLVQPDAVEN